MALRQFGAAAAVAVTLALVAACDARACGDRDPVVARHDRRRTTTSSIKLANDFNASQSDYKIVPTFKGSYADTLNAGIAAFRAGNAPQHHAGVRGRHRDHDGRQGRDQAGLRTDEGAGENFDPKSYLPAITGYYSTSKGDMLSFPFNSSTMVMWVNMDALKKAGIAEPPKTWPEVFAAAKKLQRRPTRPAASPTPGRPGP